MEKKEVFLPVAIFSTRRISALEAAVRYLRENKGFKFSEIGQLLGRDQRTIWVTYNNAAKKSNKRFYRIEESMLLPSSIFLDRRKSFLECLVVHLKNTLRLSNKEISEVLQRDPRTIGTVYDRAVRKQVLLRKLPK